MRNGIFVYTPMHLPSRVHWRIVSTSKLLFIRVSLVSRRRRHCKADCSADCLSVTCVTINIFYFQKKKSRFSNSKRQHCEVIWFFEVWKFVFSVSAAMKGIASDEDDVYASFVWYHYYSELACQCVMMTL